MSAQGTALVTGGARRIGRAIVEALTDDGWAVGIHCGRSLDEAEGLAGEIEAKGGHAAALQADLADGSETASLVGRCAERLGPVSLLVNNASVFERDDFGDFDAERWTRHMQINLRAPHQLTDEFARQLPEGMDGNIINIIDQRVLHLTPFFASYTLSKAGLWTLTQTSAMALAPRIRVNAIGPGPALPSQRQSMSAFRDQQKAVPLERGPGLEEFPAAVRFILNTPSLTAQIILLDGGQHLPWPPMERRLAENE